MKVLANDGISPAGKAKLEAAGFEVSLEKIEQNNLADAINKNGYTTLLVRSATEARQNLIDACPNLKIIGRGGVGLDNIDVKYAQSKGIEVINTPGASAQSVAELVMTHMFSMARQLYDSNRQMPIKGNSEFKELKKKYGKGLELRKKSIGIIGIGKIGQEVAKYALGCGMRVFAYDPWVNEIDIKVEIQNTDDVIVTIKPGDLDYLLANSDFITLHVPKQPDGSAVISTSEFEKMKNGVIIVNAARGGVVDETTLLNALNSGKVAHAALDVFENEPTPKAELLQHPNISLTPHIGAATVEAQERIGVELAEKLIAFFEKAPVV
ncbi:MAG: 3-phosphoglycerate dehydrogenase [Flavobacteriales bacterium]|nr:MAG: 3-phosphoglycerate dehydrogenase [Flavobacteriales bacterium]